MKKLNIEATKRLEEVRKALTCIAFAEKPTEYEKQQEKILNEEYDEIIAKYDIVDVYIPQVYNFNTHNYEAIGKECATREEANEYIKGKNYSDVSNIKKCYEKEEI